MGSVAQAGTRGKVGRVVEVEGKAGLDELFEVDERVRASRDSSYRCREQTR